MGKLRLTLGCARYDRTVPLIDGRVVPEGVDLNYVPLEPEELFWRMAQHSEFDASEFSLCAYTILMGRGDRRFVAIPVFPSRFFRHSCVYVNTNSGIVKPEDLRQKRVGVPDYTMTANVWIRGFLQHDYGVHPTEIQWFTGGLDQPGRKQRIATKPIEGLSVTPIGQATLSDMLEAGEIDAVIGAREPRPFRMGSPKVQRLWPNYKEVEQEYFTRTGVFPIMHTVVIRREVYEKNPWVAQNLFKAFEESRLITLAEMKKQSALRHMLPWLIAELERTVELMGEEYWPYGVESNRHTLELFIQYCVEQGLAESAVDLGDFFARETLDTSRI